MPSSLPLRMASFGPSFLDCFGGRCSVARVRRAFAAARRRWPDAYVVREGQSLRLHVPSEKHCCRLLVQWGRALV